MDSSFREQGPGTPQAPKSFLAGLGILASLIHWLAGLIGLTKEEREDAGVYLDRLGGE
jgi:hypothetical protein